MTTPRTLATLISALTRATRSVRGPWLVACAVTLGTAAANEWSFDYVRVTTSDGGVATVCDAVVSYRPAEALPGGGVRFHVVPELLLAPRRSGVLTGDRAAYEVVAWDQILALHLVGDGAGQPGWSIVRTDGIVDHGPSAEVWIEGEAAPEPGSPIVGQISWSMTPGDGPDAWRLVAVVFPTNLAQGESPLARCP